MARQTITVLALSLLIAVPARAAMLQAGEPFPAWRLPDHTGAEVDSVSLTGKTYLLWYFPKAMTPGCTAEGIALRDRHDELRAAGVEILGVSFDSPKDNARFVEEHQFPFRLLSDDGSLAVAVGAADSSDQRAPRRISYLVSPSGKVLRSYESVTPAEHAAQVLADAKKLAQPAP